jgi:S-adenosyl-L-methionine hydrolase (adenosine-forming)
MASAIITLTTDFGISDSYVAQMKGVILGINPDVNIVDISHQIGPHNIREAAFVLSTVQSCFPKGTIHLAVVDPGVGTRRRAIILRTLNADLIAPDNGVLSYVFQQVTARSIKHPQIKTGSNIEAVAITNPQYFRSPVSNTFHGRDIFAPVAAYLSLGIPLKSFGKAVTTIEILPVQKPFISSDGSITGEIMHVDRFGNLISNIKEEDLPLQNNLTIEIGKRKIHGLSKTYMHGEKLLAIINSNGYLEISLRAGNAGTYLHAGEGGEVKVKPGFLID